MYIPWLAKEPVPVDLVPEDLCMYIHTAVVALTFDHTFFTVSSPAGTGGEATVFLLM